MPIGPDNTRRLRPKERKIYDDIIDEDDIDGRRTFNLTSKLESNAYSSSLVKEVRGTDLNMRYMQENGFSSPLLIRDKTGLGMRIPSENFTVNDVKQCVGSRRQLDVMDVTTQKAMEMSMKEWVRYYTSEERDRLLNVISLEFSHTRLETYVEQPEVVRQMDWVDRVWPWYHKESQTETTNILEKMKYPKVQKYCLMSVKGCYTDFHIDMGGTSVWYHILKGKKIFWLIPPTESNLTLYQQWTLSAKQGDIFFADKVTECQRIQLEAGWTFFIPTGWIHAVYTPEDSLVFGGNFLHTLNSEMQLRVWEVENSTHVPGKFRYPYFTELHWYVLERYVSQLMGHEHRTKTKEEIQMGEETHDEQKVTAESDCNNLDKSDMSKESDDEYLSPQSPLSSDHNYISSPTSYHVPKSEKSCSSSNGSSHGGKFQIKPVSIKLENCQNKKYTSPVLHKPWVHLVQGEVDGIRAVLEWILNLPLNKRMVPNDILDPDGLIRDAEKLIKQHSDDDQDLAVSGEPVLKWLGRKGSKFKVRNYTSFFPRQPKEKKSGRGVMKSSVSRRRRVRCRKCEPCTREDCRECSFCKDMKKYGGPGRMKQTCFCRQCIAPILPHLAACAICKTDLCNSDEVTTLMECGLCWEIVHPRCLREKQPELTNEGVINEDLPNSWECPKCCVSGQQELCNPRISKGLAKCKKSENLDSPSNDITENEVPDVEKIIIKEMQPSVKVVRVDSLKSVASFSDSGSDNLSNQEMQPTVKVVRMKATEISNRSSSDSDSIRSSRKRDSHKRSKIDLRNASLRDRSSSNSVSPPPRKQAKDNSASPSNGANSSQRVTSRGRQGMYICPASPPSKKEASVPPAKASTSGSQRSGGGGGGEEAPGGREGHDSHEGGGGGQRPLPGSSTDPPDQRTRKECTLTAKYVVRPAPIAPPPKYTPLQNGKNHVMDLEAWMHVFSFLWPRDLAACMRVCKTWHRWCLSPDLWQSITLERKRVRQTHLVGIVMRQPKYLNLSWTNVSRVQLDWLMPRLPHLKHLQLAGNSWGAVCSLCSFTCPLLTSVDLGWVQGFGDPALYDMITPPIDRRPGLDDSVSRFHRCTKLSIAGTDISNESLKVILNHCALLKHLDISYCARITNSGIHELAASPNAQDNLIKLNATGCSKLNNKIFPSLEKLEKLQTIILQGCPLVNPEACKTFCKKITQQGKPTTMQSEKYIKIKQS